MTVDDIIANIETFRYDHAQIPHTIIAGPAARRSMLKELMDLFGEVPVVGDSFLFMGIPVEYDPLLDDGDTTRIVVHGKEVSTVYRATLPHWRTHGKETKHDADTDAVIADEAAAEKAYQKTLKDAKPDDNTD